MPVTILENRWPLVIVRWPKVTTKEDVARYLELSLEHLRRRELHAILHDATLGVDLPATERKRFGDHIAQQGAAIRAYTVAVAIVSPSPILRGLVTAVSWIAPTPCPQRAFSSATDAEEWITNEYRRRAGRELTSKSA